MNPDYCLVFYHIPKTAGTSFTSLLESQYGKNHSFHLRGRHKLEDIARYRALEETEKRKVHFISGHLSQLLEDDVPLPLRYVTFLREPTEQFLSSYHYIKQTPHNVHHEAVKNLDSLEQFLDWQIDSRLDSKYARYLGDATRYFEERDQHAVNMQDPVEGEAIYRKAAARLESIEFVFITEAFDEAIMILANKLDWPKLPFYSKKNRSRHIEQINPGLRDRIREVHQYDFMLYEQAIRQHQQLASGLNLRARIGLPVFRWVNNARDYFRR